MNSAVPELRITRPWYVRTQAKSSIDRYCMNHRPDRCLAMKSIFSKNFLLYDHCRREGFRVRRSGNPVRNSFVSDCQSKTTNNSYRFSQICDGVAELMGPPSGNARTNDTFSPVSPRCYPDGTPMVPHCLPGIRGGNEVAIRFQRGTNKNLRRNL
jgi:hypothetical protein